MRILSGIQPSGALHIGNYFGMMRPAIALQDEGEAFYFIANYHALTSVRDPEALRENSSACCARFSRLRSGPGSAVLFLQSDVPAGDGAGLDSQHGHADGTARARAFLQGQDRAGMRANRPDLFTYPVLMAADILIYDSDVVPVGKDQKQHIEVTRDIAVKMNETFGQVFKLPEPRIQPRDGSGARPRRPEDEQELRQHDRDFRRRKGNAKTRHEHRDRFDAGRSAERSRKLDDFPALFALRVER